MSANDRVIDVGDGQPVVMLHGLGGFKEIWTPQVKYLSEHGLRSLAVDLRGHGSAPDIEPGWRLRDVAADVLEILQDRDVVEPIIVGHSFGGRVMFQTAVLWPERLRGLVAVSAQSASPSGAYRSVLKDVATATAADGLEGFRAGFEAADEIPARVGSDISYAQWYWEHFYRNRPADICKSLAILMAMADLTERVTQLDLPMQCIVGDADTPFVQFAQMFESRMKRCRSVYIEDCGHYPMVDAQQRFDDVLLQFIHDLEGP